MDFKFLGLVYYYLYLFLIFSFVKNIMLGLFIILWLFIFLWIVGFP